MHIVVSLLMEKLVDGNSHVVSDTQYGTEGIGTGAQIGYIAEEF